MLKLNLEDLRYMTTEDYKAMMELRKNGVPDDIIQLGIKNTLERNKKEAQDAAQARE